MPFTHEFDPQSQMVRYVALTKDGAVLDRLSLGIEYACAMPVLRKWFEKHAGPDDKLEDLGSPEMDKMAALEHQRLLNAIRGLK